MKNNNYIMKLYLYFLIAWGSVTGLMVLGSLGEMNSRSDIFSLIKYGVLLAVLWVGYSRHKTNPNLSAMRSCKKRVIWALVLGGLGMISDFAEAIRDAEILGDSTWLLFCIAIYGTLGFFGVRFVKYSSVWIAKAKKQREEA